MEDESEVIVRPVAGPRRTNILNGRTTKRRGELAELAFMYKAASLGFGVAKPYGDSDPYDFILDSGKRLWRVQVKSTLLRRSDGYLLNTLHNAAGGPRKAYDANEIDVLVGYVFPCEAWYVFPVAAVAPFTSVYVVPNGVSRGRYRHEQFRDAWCHMACLRDGPFANISVERRCQREGTCPLSR